MCKRRKTIRSDGLTIKIWIGKCTGNAYGVGLLDSAQGKREEEGGKAFRVVNLRSGFGNSGQGGDLQAGLPCHDIVAAVSFACRATSRGPGQ